MRRSVGGSKSAAVTRPTSRRPPRTMTSASCGSSSPTPNESRGDRADLGDAFFEKVEEENLAVVYQEETEGDRMSRFYRFVDRESV